MRLNPLRNFRRSPHLRAAIERIGIEKPSDVTLVMEEVGRMEAEAALKP